MEKFKTITFAVLSFAICIILASCNDQDKNEEFDELALYLPAEDRPIQSLPSNSRDLMQVSDGKCVIGVIQYCGKRFGQTISEEDIMAELENYAEYSGETLIGFNLNSYEWDDALKNWFYTTWPEGQNALIKAVFEGQIACCRLASDNGRAHAVVLTGVDGAKYQFKYYDPVLGADLRVPYYKVYDPRIIHSLK